MSNNKKDLFIFVSYNSTDHKFVLSLAEALTARDLTVFLDRWEQPEQQLALHRQANDPAFSMIPVLLPGAR